MSKKKPSEIDLVDLLLQRLGNDERSREAVEAVMDEVGQLLVDGTRINLGALATLSTVGSRRHRVMCNTHGRSVPYDLPPRLRLRIEPSEDFRPRLLLAENEPDEEPEPKDPPRRVSLKELRRRQLRAARQPSFPTATDSFEVQNNAINTMPIEGAEDDQNDDQDEAGDGVDAAASA